MFWILCDQWQETAILSGPSLLLQGIFSPVEYIEELRDQCCYQFDKTALLACKWASSADIAASRTELTTGLHQSHQNTDRRAVVESLDEFICGLSLSTAVSSEYSDHR